MRWDQSFHISRSSESALGGESREQLSCSFLSGSGSHLPTFQWQAFCTPQWSTSFCVPVLAHPARAPRGRFALLGSLSLVPERLPNNVAPLSLLSSC